MDLAGIPWAGGSLVGIALALIFSVAGFVLKGILVHRSVLDDVRKDRDARLADAEREAEQWRHLYETEKTAHDTTRQAHAEKVEASAYANAEAAQLAAALLTEIRARVIEAKQ